MPREYTIYVMANGTHCNDYFDKDQRRIILKFMDHVHLFRKTGDESYLYQFSGVIIRSRNGSAYRLETRPNVLRRLIAELGTQDDQGELKV